MLCVLPLLGCAVPDIQTYQKELPQLDPARFFVGRTEAWGMFQKRNGAVTKRFKVEIEGHLEGGKLLLDENFTYSDGSRQKRLWILRRQADGSWQGEAADVIGKAHGETSGNALHWTYSMRLPVDGREYHVDFDDWMYLIDDRTMINRARMSKFGFELGSVTLFFRKPV
jgi:hypothetical protein